MSAGLAESEEEAAERSGSKREYGMEPEPVLAEGVGKEPRAQETVELVEGSWEICSRRPWEHTAA